MKEIRVGGSFISIWLCNKHENERWDVFTPERPICTPCEVLKLRKEVEELKEWLNVPRTHDYMTVDEYMEYKRREGNENNK